MGIADNEHNKQANYNESWKVCSTMGGKIEWGEWNRNAQEKKEAAILNKMTKAGITEKVAI